MAIKTLGKVSLTTGGAYNATTTYDRLTMVLGADGCGYISRLGGVYGIEPGVTQGWQTFWMKISDAGNGIAGVAKTGTAGLVDTYTITYTNGDTDTFTVTNGSGVPPGGSAGQVLKKASSTDYDVAWANISSYFTPVLNGDGTYTLQIAGGT